VTLNAGKQISVNLLIAIGTEIRIFSIPLSLCVANIGKYGIHVSPFDCAWQK